MTKPKLSRKEADRMGTYCNCKNSIYTRSQQSKSAKKKAQKPHVCALPKPVRLPSRLQIPKPKLVILTSTSDPLSTCIAKARRDAIFRVRAPGVRLKSPRGGVVPQTDERVVGGGHID
jgi:hypothetical protein